MNKTRWILGSVAVAAVLAGCGDVGDAATADNAASTDTQEARAASWERLVGSWAADGAGLYANLVFSSTADANGHRYFGTRVVTCVRAPCNPVREDGTYTAGTSNLVLTDDAATLRLTYTLSGDTLTLHSGSRVVGRMHRDEGFCGTAADCDDQGMYTPMCVGAWACSANHCGFHCGLPDNGPSCLTLTCAHGYHCEQTSGHGRCVTNTDPCATVRCASGTHCVASGSTAACVATGGGYGADCGGIAGLGCAPGYTCVLTSNLPDAMGYCHGVSSEGGSCGGGSIRFPSVCEAGTHCEGPSTSRPGATGSCVRDSGPTCRTLTCASGHHCETVNGHAACVANGGGLGATCGGFAGLRCGTGYTCVLPTPTHPDAAGTCRPVSSFGGPCGGTTLYPPVCAEGLVCNGPALHAPLGAHGTCELPVR